MKKCKYHCDYGDGENCNYEGKDGCMFNKGRSLTEKKTPTPRYDMNDLFYIDAAFCTDGDFSFREAEREEIKKEFKVKFDFDDCEDYYLNGYLDRMHMSWLLHHLMTSFHVGAGHYWLVPKLYNLFNDAFENWHLKDEYYGSIGGNYDGTEVYIHKVAEIS